MSLAYLFKSPTRPKFRTDGFLRTNNKKHTKSRRKNENGRTNNINNIRGWTFKKSLAPKQKKSHE